MTFVYPYSLISQKCSIQRKLPYNTWQSQSLAKQVTNFPLLGSCSSFLCVAVIKHHECKQFLKRKSLLGSLSGSEGESIILVAESMMGDRHDAEEIIESCILIWRKAEKEKLDMA